MYLKQLAFCLSSLSLTFPHHYPLGLLQIQMLWLKSGQPFLEKAHFDLGGGCFKQCFEKKLTLAGKQYNFSQLAINIHLLAPIAQMMKYKYSVDHRQSGI